MNFNLVFLRGDYYLGFDECLILNLGDGEISLMERYWYVSFNF